MDSLPYVLLSPGQFTPRFTLTWAVALLLLLLGQFTLHLLFPEQFTLRFTLTWIVYCMFYSYLEIYSTFYSYLYSLLYIYYYLDSLLQVLLVPLPGKSLLHGFSPTLTIYSMFTLTRTVYSTFDSYLDSLLCVLLLPEQASRWFNGVLEASYL